MPTMRLDEPANTEGVTAMIPLDYLIVGFVAGLFVGGIAVWWLLEWYFPEE